MSRMALQVQSKPPNPIPINISRMCDTILLLTDAVAYGDVRKSKTRPIRKAGNVPNGPDCDPNPN